MQGAEKERSNISSSSKSFEYFRAGRRIGRVPENGEGGGGILQQPLRLSLSGGCICEVLKSF